MSGDEIVVLPGTYVERLDFLGKDLLLRSAGGPWVTILDGGGLGTTVTFENGESELATIAGFTITGGRAVQRGPGGMRVRGATRPVIRDCRFVANEGRVGGAGALEVDQGGAPTVERCAFLGNIGGDGDSSTGVFADGGAGAIDVDTDSGLRVGNCLFEGNIGGVGGSGITGSGSFDNGGPGVLRCDRAVVAIEHSTFRGNAGGRAGETTGFAYGGAGALFAQFSFLQNVQIRGCVFESNAGGPAGPSRRCDGGAGAVHALAGAILLEECVFRANVGGPGEVAEDRGGSGAVMLWGSSSELRRCEFRQNRGGHVLRGGWYGGAGAFYTETSGRIEGCRFSGNEGGAATVPGQGLRGGAGAIEAETASVFVTVRGSTIEQNRGGDAWRTAGSGAVLCTGATSIAIQACTIRENEGGRSQQSQQGGAGAFYFQGGAPSIVDSLIEANRGGSGPDIGGAGVLESVASTARFERCEVRSNQGAAGSDVGLQEAGSGVVHAASTGEPVFRRCRIEQNRGGNGGSGVGDRGGAGVGKASRGGQVRFEDCDVSQNVGGHGGLGTSDRGGAGAFWSEDSGSLVLVNCLVARNLGGSGGEAGSTELQSGDRGGPGAVFMSPTAASAITNCTVVSNVAGRTTPEMEVPGGILVRSGTLTNSIVVSNLAALGPANVAGNALDGVTHCCVGELLSGPGNFSADPRFVDPANGDYRLECTSPCVDAGSASAPELPLFDFEGDPRSFGVAPDVGLDETGVERLGQSRCVAAPNSTGLGSTLVATGNGFVDDDCFVLRANAVTGVGGMLYSETATQASFGDGVRCVGGQAYRLPPSIPSGGILSVPVDLLMIAGGITPGSTWHFQAWYRDPGSSAAGFNLSDSVSVTFEP